MAGYRPKDWHVLDLEKDPTPGDPERVRSLAKNLQDFADDVAEGLRLVKGMAGEDVLLQWAGKSAEVFAEEFDDVPKNLKKLTKSYGMAGDALADYWPKLERAQSLADKALAKGREAQSDLKSANSRLSDANSWVSRATKESDKYQKDKEKGEGGGKDVPKPDEDKVRQATRNANSANDEKDAAQGDVTAANNALDAAKKMAEDARKMREDAAREAKNKLEEASDAGIQNRSWWEEIGDWVSDNWDDIVAVCKVVVAVVGIVAMIIGGPILAAVVLIAAAVVLADTLYKYSKGQATLLDVGLAALDMIPGMKGITTLGALAKGAKSLGKAGLGAMAKGLKGGLRRGADDAVASSKPTKGRCKNGEPVDMISGEMIMEELDVSLNAVLGLTVRRTHLSTYRTGRWFGPSWTSTLDERLELDDEGVLFATSDGMILVYPVPRGGEATFPVEGPRWPLTWASDPATEQNARRSDGLKVTDPKSGVSRHFGHAGVHPVHDREFTMPIRAVEDRNGNRVDFDYATDGTPKALRHSGGYQVDVDTDGNRVTALRLRPSEPWEPEGAAYPTTENSASSPTPSGSTLLVRYGYEAGRLTEVYNSSGLPQRLDYDHEDRIVAWSGRNGTWYRYEYDAEHRVTSGEGIDGVMNCTIDYDTPGRTTRYTDSLGRTTTYQYNERMQLVSSSNALGQSMVNEWDRYDRLLAQTDALGHTFRYRYDTVGNLASAVRPDGSSTEVEYNDFHQPVFATTPDGGAWSHQYDERGNLTATVDPTGAEVRYAYGSTGGLEAVTDQVGATSRAVCDAAGLPIEFIDPQGLVSIIGRDAFGRVTAHTDPLGRTTRFGFSVEGRALWRETPEGYRDVWEWDAEGNPISRTDPTGAVSRCTVGPFGQIASRTDAAGTTYTFRYDTELNLLSVGGPEGRPWEYVYDEANRVVSETDFSGRRLSYEVDAMGRLLARTNGAGETMSFRRDELGRLVESLCDGRSTTFTYDATGRLVREAGPEATVEREYSTRGLLLAESIDGRTTTFTYDVLGRRIGRRTPTGIESTWSYDAVGDPTALDTDGHRMTFAFDGSHRETNRLLPGGISLGQNWDADGRLTRQNLTGLDLGEGVEAERDHRALLQQRTYTYRADGVPTSVDELGRGTRRFALDGVGRVTGVDARGWTERYQYDEAGNICHASTPTDDDGDRKRVYAGTQVRRTGRVRYERDEEGRVVRTTKRLLNGQKRVRSYRWDGRNRLIGMTTPEGDAWAYAYDPTGRRIAKRRLGSDGNPVEEVLFAWDGNRLIEQVTGDGRVSSWEYRPGSHQPLAQLDRNRQGEQARFHAIVTDLTGAPTELVSATGEVVPQGRTTLWGVRLPAALQEEGGDDRVECPLRFPGQYADEETGWHYNYKRYYDPHAAQYMTPDPLGLAPSANDSGYVSNPYRWVDPLGLWWQDPNNGNQFARDPSLPEGEREFTRGNQYPSDYRQSTHDHMTANYTDEGIAQGQAPRNAEGERIPRDQLNWNDPDGNRIWDPNAENDRPFHRTVTYEHQTPVVDHWNNEGRFSDRATRNDFYNNTDHMVPMDGIENSRGGGNMSATYIQETGAGYSCS